MTIIRTVFWKIGLIM